MNDKIFFDPINGRFELGSEYDAGYSKMKPMDSNKVYIDGPICPDYVVPNKLIGLIINHNRDIKQGIIKDYPINYDEALLRDAIEKYNDIVERKYRDNLRKRNK